MEMSAKNGPPLPSPPLRWLPELWELGRKRLRPQARLLGLSLVVGVVAGLGAIVFYLACQVVVHYALENLAGYRPSSPRGEPRVFRAEKGTRAPSPEGAQPAAELSETPPPDRPWLLLVIPTVGGLMSGLIVFTLAPEAEGHGTDSAIDAYHHKQGYLRPRVPAVKIVASAITIGSGGSGGREGPIAQIGAGIGSLLGTVLRLGPAQRRILMAAGMGAGVAAIFRAPLAGALFAAEVLYRSPDFESEVIIPAALASIIAYCTFGLYAGWEPLFTIPKPVLAVLTFSDPLQLLLYTVLALFLVVMAMVYTRSFYGLTHLFHRLSIPRQFKPAVGAFLTGALGLTLFYLFTRGDVLAVLSFGYGILQDILQMGPDVRPSFVVGGVLLAVAFGKILTTGLTIGSGGSGGVFGPSMVIGGCAGGALGIFFGRLWPEVAPHPAAFAIVGMAGFFAAAAKTPFSTLIIVSEMTGNYNLLLPTLWVCTLAFLLSDEQSIYSAQVESRSRSPAHQGDYVREVLAGLRVRQFLTPGREVPTIKPSDSLPEVIDKLSSVAYHGLPVTDEQGRFLGHVSLEEVHLASLSPHLRPLVIAADLMRTDVTPLKPDDTLDRALELFVESDRLALAVVDGTPEQRVIGVVKRSEISSTYLRHVHALPVAGDGAAAQT
jgi:CIC family chloride channel protein